jgi:hypothetical protein
MKDHSFIREHIEKMAIKMQSDQAIEYASMSFIMPVSELRTSDHSYCIVFAAKAGEKSTFMLSSKTYLKLKENLLENK